MKMTVEADNEPVTPTKADLLSLPQLEEALWHTVTSGKLKELKKHLEEQKSHPKLLTVLNSPCESYDEDGGHMLIQCVREGRDRGPSFGGKDYGGCMSVLVEYGTDIDVTDKSYKTALSWAVTLKCSNYLTRLLKLGADANIYDHDGFSPLHLAISRGNKDLVVRILDQRPQSVNHPTEEGVPPLVIAVNYGHIEVCRLLLEHGADVNLVEEKTKRSPVYNAIHNKHIDILDVLLKYKPNLDTVDSEGHSILYLVCELSDIRFFHKIISHCPQFSQKIMDRPSDEGFTPVIVACKNGNSEQLKHLLEEGASVTARDGTGKTALHHCADNLETQCAEMLLARDAAIIDLKDEQGYTVFTLAVLVGNLNLIKLLIDKGADIDTQDNEGHKLTHWAAVCGHLKVLDILIQHKADMSTPDFHHAYPIHYAAQMNGNNSGHTDAKIAEKVLKKFLECKVKLDVTDDAGRQPLLWAACSGNAESCKLLLKAGADINSLDKDNLTALHCAASRGHDQCIEVLRKHGADVDLNDNNKCTPLFYAITLGNLNCTKALIAAKADVNHIDDRGRNPVHCAAIKGCLDTIKLLEREKADLWHQNNKGDYPIHEAGLKGHINVVKHLLRQKNDKEAVNVTNDLGKTLLHIAAATNNLPLVKLLLNQDCNKNALMKHAGKEFTPYDIAVIKNYEETARYLKEKGALPYADLSNTQKQESKTAKSEKQKPEAEKDEKDKKGEKGGKGVKSTKEAEKEGNKAKGKSPAKEKKEGNKEKTPEKKDPKAAAAAVAATKAADAKKKKDQKETQGKQDKGVKGEKNNENQEDTENKDTSEEKDIGTTSVNEGPAKDEKKDTEKANVDKTKKSKDKVDKGKDKKDSDKKPLPKKPSNDSVLEKEDGIRASPVSDELLIDSDEEGQGQAMGNKQGKKADDKENMYVSLEKTEPRDNERQNMGTRSEGRKSTVGFRNNLTDNEDSGNETDPGRSKSRRTMRSVSSKKPYLDSVKRSVKAYQTKRNTSRSLHQLKRAQLHTGPMHDIVMFSKMMDNYRKGVIGEEDEMDLRNYSNWNGYLNDQLKFVSHLYNDENRTPREVQEMAKDSETTSLQEQHAQLESEANRSRLESESRCDTIGKDQETQRQQNREMDKEIDNLAARTAELFDNVKLDATDSAASAKTRNEKLREEMRQSRDEKIRTSSDPREREMLQRQQLEDEMEERRAEMEMERRERIRNWHRRKNEDMRKRLLSAYRPVFPNDVFKQHSVCISGGRVKSAGRLAVNTPPTTRSKRPQISPSPRPTSHKSESSSAAQFRSKDEKTQVQMTPYGLRRVRNQDRPTYDEVESELADAIFFNANPRTKSADLADRRTRLFDIIFPPEPELFHPKQANWSRKFDGNIRPRTGLVFVDPHVYTDLMHEERTAKQRISTEVRSHLTNGQAEMMPNGDGDSLLS